MAVKKDLFHIDSLMVLLICLLLFVNLYGPDPVDYLIIAYFVFGIIPITRFLVGLRLSLGVALAIICFLASYIISAGAGEFDSFFTINFFINIILYIIIVSYATTEVRFRRVIVSLSLGFSVSLLIAFYQVIGILPIFTAQFEVVRHTRFMGLYGDPNLLGISAVFFCIYWMNEMISMKRPTFAFSMISSSFFLVSLITLIFTQSRSAWGGFIIAISLYFILKTKYVNSSIIRHFKRILILLVTALTILWGIGVDDIIERRVLTAFEIETVAEAERFNFYFTVKALEVAITNPMGVGPGNLANFTRLSSQDGEPIGAHNVFAQIIAENGWVAGLSFLYLIAVFLINSIRIHINKKTRNNISVIAAPLLFSVIFFGVFQDLIQWKLFWIAVALISSIIMVNHARKG